MEDLATKRGRRKERLPEGDNHREDVYERDGPLLEVMIVNGGDRN